MEEIWSTLKAAPSEAWVALLGVIFGSLLTTFGVWLTYRFNRKQLKMQLEHNEKIQRQRISKERLEELYIEVNNWGTVMYASYLTLEGLMKGDLGLENYYKTLGDATEISVCNFGRLEMIVGIYGRNFLEAHNEVKRIRDSIAVIESDFMNGKLKDNPCTVLNSSYRKLTKAIDLLKMQVVNAAQEV